MSFVAVAVGTGGAIIGGALQGGGTAAAGKASGEATKYSADVQKQIAEALGRGQEEALGRAQNIYGTGSDQFRKDTTGTPAAIGRLQELIRNRATKEQQQALSRGKLGLQQAGVRGPEAALMSQMQSNELAESLGGRVQSLALQQQLADREKRAQFGQQQALAGMARTLTPVQKFVGKNKLVSDAGKAALGVKGY